MPKPVTILGGLIVVSAITYKIREDRKNETRLGQQQLPSSIDSGLEKEVDMIQRSLENSQTYIKQRLIPSVKASWNEHVTNATHAMIKSDLPTQAGRLWNKHVLGHSDSK
ncbi:uncharacterized protein BX664DRAFT_338828 [Halteromyces radiatus]|uniref:uncharacterized protein n=1 Tax=Halteromyces radiatus TaxID=101107 RepID=UPI00221E5AC5|nr:uncharacterized protein BX664DRAFT_338828 [Halteromyces radiatus]KAI8085210.1 hypothetical protein BX664DRAFT_338828 [Halteromyces radiatus]